MVIGDLLWETCQADLFYLDLERKGIEHPITYHTRLTLRSTLP
jgi:hypothetical protein